MILYPTALRNGAEKGLMKKRTVFITLTLLLAALVAACQTSEATRLRGIAAETRKNGGAAPVAATPLPPAPAEPVQLATLEDRRIDESSGLVASRRSPGLFWTHNDSGDGPVVYAFDRKGRSRGTWHVEGASARDWEDIAAGPGPVPGQSYLYAGDIGDNGREREFVVVYRFPEPELSATQAAPAEARPTQTAEAIRLKYPDGAHNAEALVVHPTTGDIYIITKASAEAGVYKLAAPFDPQAVNPLVKIATLRGPDFFGTLITGADISPDGRRVALCDYAQGYELRLPEGSKDFDEVWRQTPLALSLGARLQGESVAYRLDGAALLATSENTPTPLFEVVLPKR
jgi:hypothetical protein